MKTKQLILKWLILPVIFLTITQLKVNAQVKRDAILGEWLPPKKDAHFLIYKEGGKYFGKIIWVQGDNAKDLKKP